MAGADRGGAAPDGTGGVLLPTADRRDRARRADRRTRAPGGLTDEQNDDAVALAAGLTTCLLERGDPALLPQDDSDPLPFLQHAEVHQATGMISVQLAVPLAEALLRVRAHAYGSGRTLTDTARDIVARRLRLAPDTDPPPPAADKDRTP